MRVRECKWCGNTKTVCNNSNTVVSPMLPGSLDWHDTITAVYHKLVASGINSLDADAWVFAHIKPF